MSREEKIIFGTVVIFVIFVTLLLIFYFFLKKDIRTLITSGIYACTLLVILWQTYEIIKQRKTDIERRNRETTINVLSSWLKTFERKAILARHILSELDENSIKRIFNFNEVSLPTNEEKKKKILNLLYALDKDIYNSVKKSEKIEASHSAYLRSLMAEYLNTLEIILLAWDQNIIDEDTFKKEFKYLVRSNRCILDKILEAVGKENFPVIMKFCQKLIDEQKQDSNPSKEPLS